MVKLLTAATDEKYSEEKGSGCTTPGAGRIELVKTLQAGPDDRQRP